MRIWIAILLVGVCAPSAWSKEPAARGTKWSIYFSPQGGCTEAVVEALSGIAHNKIMVTDGQTVITGSFNFTKAVEDKNAEKPAGD
jgi:phosphatidylserine/phosphatidylglycerophosphate/cardiolipin synthase-like enzyme